MHIIIIVTILCYTSLKYVTKGSMKRATQHLIDPSSSDHFFASRLYFTVLFLETKFSFIFSSERNFPREQMTRMKRDRQDTTRGLLEETLRRNSFAISGIAVVSKTSSLLRGVKFSTGRRNYFISIVNMQT